MTERDRIQAALCHVPAHDRDLWLRIGMAIKSELGDEGFDLWDEWSQKDESYNVKDVRTVWKSINGNGRVTIGTLYHEAKRHGVQFTGENCPQPPTPEELEAQRCAAAEQSAQAEAEEQARHEVAAQRAVTILKAATADPATHPYAIKKRVSLGPLVKRGVWPQRGWQDALLVPIYGAYGRVQSIEAINTDGHKCSLKGGNKRGGFHPFGKVRGASRVFIAEGVANAAVGAEVDKSPAVAAMGKSNIVHAALAVRKLAPDAELIILADNDRKPAKETYEAAVAVGGRVVVPELDGRKCDFWDVWNEHGVEAVRAAIANASAPIGGEPHPDPENAAAGAELVFRCLADVEARPIQWLWPKRIARGKLTVIAGHPGLGKSQLTVSLAAVVSSGGQWPADRTRCEPGSVVLLSAEDDAGDTIRPRLEAAGADLTRCHILEAVRGVDDKGNPWQRAFSLKADIERLGGLLAMIGNVRLVVVDPISAYLGDTDSHKNADVRALLSPLGDLAAKHGAAFVAVSHF